MGKHYYDLYDSWTNWEYKPSLDYFEAAIKADSLYADAYIGKANLLLAVAWRKHLDPDSIKNEIEKCINKAIEINPYLGSSYVAEGYLHYLYDFNFELAEELYKKAIELEPNCDICYYRYFFLKFVLGEFDEARKLIDKAIELNPLNSGYHALKGETYWAEMKYDSAIAVYQQNLVKFPNDIYSTWGMACTYGWSGEYDKAIEMINGIPGYKDRNFAAAIFSTLKGDTLYAQMILDKLLDSHSQNSYTESWTWPIAAIYANLGEYDTAIEWLEKGPIDFMYIADWFRPLREIPRFKILLKAHGFDGDNYVN